MPKLDRMVHFDERSRNFPIRTLVAGRAPRSYTWRPNICLDQGQEGACAGFAWSHELAANPKPQAGITNQFARERVYWEAQRLDDWPGGDYPGATPRYEGTSVLAGAKTVAALGAVTEYRWAFGLSDLVLAIGYSGPAVLGINWYSGMFTPDSAGLIHVSGDIEGGHAIMANGVSVTKRLVRLHNSWGSTWGQSGNCFIGFDDLSRLLSEQGEACIPTVRHLIEV